MPNAALHVRHVLGESIEVSHDGTALLSYRYLPDDVQLESPRPFLHPVRTLSGGLVSLYRPHDHVWHKGLAWSLPVVGDHNFWGGPTFVREEGYVQLENNGSQDHVAFTTLDRGDDGVTIGHDLHWHTQHGEAVIAEHRTLTVSVPDDDGAAAAGAPGSAAWVLTFTSRMRNVSAQPLDLGSPTTRGRENAGYGGLFWRGPRDLTAGTLLAPGFAGGEELRGQRAPWAGFTGHLDGTGDGVSLVIVDDVANPHHPPQWFARNEWWAGLNPAPFFTHEVAFAPGDELTFGYAVVIADGAADPERAAALAALGTRALAARVPTAP